MIDTNLVNWPEERVAKLMSHYKEILSLLGEDPEREGTAEDSGTCGKSHADFNPRL